MVLLSELKDGGTRSVAMPVHRFVIADLKSISKICLRKDGGSQPLSFLRRSRKGAPQSNSILRRSSLLWDAIQDNMVLLSWNNKPIPMPILTGILY